MRIVHLTDRLTDRGGAHRHLLSVVLALAQRGHEVHLATGCEDAFDEEVPARVHHVPGLEVKTAASVRVHELLRRLEPEVVHVHTVMNPAALEQAAAWGAVFTVQDHRCFCPARGKWTGRGEVCRADFSPTTCAECFADPRYFDEMVALTRARLAALGQSTAIVLSDYMRGELVRAGLSAQRVHVVPPFVDFADGGRGPAAEGSRCVLFMGRLVEAKGPMDAVQAWRRSGLALPLLVAGTGPLRDAVQASGAEVLGWVPHRRLPALLRRARALLMPSRWQKPFGIAGLEALSFGVPVVAWDSGGIREWHPGPLVPWGDVDGLARALRHAVQTTAVAPAGFERERLMDRLELVYRDMRHPLQALAG